MTTQIYRLGKTTTNLSRRNFITMTTPEKPRIIALFDVDGTLTIPRGEITTSMMNFMQELSKKVTVGIVGGKFKSWVVVCNELDISLTSKF